MKKIYAMIIICALIVVSLTACNSAKLTLTTSGNTISAAQLTDREKMLLSLDKQAYFVFDYQFADKDNWMDLRVDKYEAGKKVSTLGNLSMGSFLTDTGTIAVMVNEPEKNTLQWTLFNTGGQTKLIDKLNFEENAPLIKTQGINEAKQLPLSDKEITLAYIGYKDGNKSNSAISLYGVFSSSPEENMKDIGTYDVVYLVQCKFYKKST